ncbi:hypothetical protein A3C96_00755 [Candidatus Uhrbacteria bacterium RIFCSPHIGHO2_02_FULL_60_10]|uniref:Transposase IS200-like domain-containing protein n=1 Tax=Candidatus Uhrbacteria bacterium RIFCSPHIGHO2_02_FULL_60_10 TaxID=1802392 RepID=A0A1F7U570_9BACT|nr:MAG: hypothetical protein A3C96_00755 [Candidatus Uhrbacteria bacterium RIFCSPHIGHO2_02_FULL_60_10]
MEYPFHLIPKGNNGQNVFDDDEDRLVMLNIIRSCKDDIGFTLYHYCLMTNHVHLVLRPHDHKKMPEITRYINLTYSLYHKKKYGRVGHLWRNRSKKYVIWNDEYAAVIGPYVESNPVKAGIVGRAEEHQWSSARFYILRKYDDLITPAPWFLALGKTDIRRIASYKRKLEFLATKNNAKKYMRKLEKLINVQITTERVAA